MNDKAQNDRSGKHEQAGEWVTHECGFCGERGGQYLAHYDIMRCFCGRLVWALRPKRDGKLKLFPYPGTAMANPPVTKARKHF